MLKPFSSRVIIIISPAFKDFRLAGPTYIRPWSSTFLSYNFSPNTSKTKFPLSTDPKKSRHSLWVLMFRYPYLISHFFIWCSNVFTKLVTNTSYLMNFGYNIYYRFSSSLGRAQRLSSVRKGMRVTSTNNSIRHLKSPTHQSKNHKEVKTCPNKEWQAYA